MRQASIELPPEMISGGNIKSSAMAAMLQEAARRGFKYQGFVGEHVWANDRSGLWLTLRNTRLELRERL